MIDPSLVVTSALLLTTCAFTTFIVLDILTRWRR